MHTQLIVRTTRYVESLNRICLFLQVIKLMKDHPPRAVEYKKTLTGVEVIDVELQKVRTSAQL